MEDDTATNPFLHAVKLNSRRRAVRYAELRSEGAVFMIECRDLWDAEDEDAGVYFVGCKNVHEVDMYIREMDPASDRVLGIYDLSKPLGPQGPGLTLGELLSR